MSQFLKAACILALCLTATLQGNVSAQQVQVGENVNVLPVFKT